MKQNFLGTFWQSLKILEAGGLGAENPAAEGKGRRGFRGGEPSAWRFKIFYKNNTCLGIFTVDLKSSF